MRNEYEPYKYVLQDITHVYIGGRFTLQEVIGFDDAPFKVKVTVNRYFLGDSPNGADIRLSDFILDVERNAFSYEVLKKLKTKVKYTIPKNFDADEGYRNTVASFEEFYENEVIRQHREQVMIEEISFSKLALMGI